jgi:hypothetical protein
MNTKTTKTTRFSDQNDNKGKPSSKSRSWNKKYKNTKRAYKYLQFYYQKKMEQGYDKKTTEKLVLNRLKVMTNFTSICTH